jgi:rsbT co-antagonist protein RsbR
VTYGLDAEIEVAGAWLAAIVNSSDDAIIGKTTQGVIRSWNIGAERLYGFTAAEVTGRPIATLFPPDSIDEEERILERVLAGERVEHYETKRLRKDGSLVDVSLSVSPIHDELGEIVGLAAIARDITARLEAERTIHELSTPALQIRDGLLVLPIIGALTVPRARLLTRGLLERIRTMRAAVVIIDVTGVPAIDPQAARELLITIESSGLMGAYVIVSGLATSIAATLVELGVDLVPLNATVDLQSGIEQAARILDEQQVR